MPENGASAVEPFIDLAYAWVDGDDPEFQDDLSRYAHRPNHGNPERFRDLYQMLRYSLRSVSRFAPWVRNVYILTRRPQVPAWLNTENPRVRVIHHDELPGFEPYLPTFNSTVIESFVPSIPGISDHILYLNDDFLFGAPTSREDFLTEEGKIRVMGTHFGVWLPFRIYRKRWKLFNTVHLEHTPRLLHRRFWEEMLEAHARGVHRTRCQRFRTGGDLRMDRLYRMWMLGHRRSQSQVVTSKDLRRIHRFHRIENDLSEQVAELRSIREMRPKFFCLNDDQGTEPHLGVCEAVRGFLEAYYPEPSEFERVAGP
jgi:hypothetical protein